MVFEVLDEDTAGATRALECRTGCPNSCSERMDMVQRSREQNSIHGSGGEVGPGSSVCGHATGSRLGDGFGIAIDRRYAVPAGLQGHTEVTGAATDLEDILLCEQASAQGMSDLAPFATLGQAVCDNDIGSGENLRLELLLSDGVRTDRSNMNLVWL